MWTLEDLAASNTKPPVVTQHKGHTKAVVNDVDWNLTDANVFASVGSVRRRPPPAAPRDAATRAHPPRWAYLGGPYRTGTPSCGTAGSGERPRRSSSRRLAWR